MWSCESEYQKQKSVKELSKGLSVSFIGPLLFCLFFAIKRKVSNRNYKYLIIMTSTKSQFLNELINIIDYGDAYSPKSNTEIKR